MKFTNKDGMLSFGSLAAGYTDEHPFGSERGDALIELGQINGGVYFIDARVEGEDRKYSYTDSGSEVCIGRFYAHDLNQARKIYKQMVKLSDKGIAAIERELFSLSNKVTGGK